MKADLKSSARSDDPQKSGLDRPDAKTGREGYESDRKKTGEQSVFRQNEEGAAREGCSCIFLQN
jgi:hypothetical protein